MPLGAVLVFGPGDHTSEDAWGFEAGEGVRGAVVSVGGGRVDGGLYPVT
jgi:hypothetical protein